MDTQEPRNLKTTENLRFINSISTPPPPPTQPPPSVPLQAKYVYDHENSWSSESIFVNNSPYMCNLNL